MQSTFKQLCLVALLGFSPLAWGASTSPTPSAEKNYSGHYSCKGNNSKVGEYAYTLTLKLNKIHSHDEVSVYDLTGETENSTMYSGNAVAIANRMSLAFRVSDHKDNIFGSGYAVFKSGAEKLWTFTTHYYEPNESGGASGTDICTQNPPPAPKKAPDEMAPKKPVDESASKKSADEPAMKKPSDEAAPRKPSSEKSGPEKSTPDEAVNKKPAEDAAPKKSTDDASVKKAPAEPAPKKSSDEVVRN